LGIRAKERATTAEKDKKNQGEVEIVHRGKLGHSSAAPLHDRAEWNTEADAGMRRELQFETRLRGANADFAGDGVNFDAAAAVAHAGAERVLALLFDDDGHVGFDLT
jgi:hypothetical protein